MNSMTGIDEVRGTISQLANLSANHILKTITEGKTIDRDAIEECVNAACAQHESNIDRHHSVADWLKVRIYAALPEAIDSLASLPDLEKLKAPLLQASEAAKAIDTDALFPPTLPTAMQNAMTNGEAATLANHIAGAAISRTEGEATPEATLKAMIAAIESSFDLSFSSARQAQLAMQWVVEHSSSYGDYYQALPSETLLEAAEAFINTPRTQTNAAQHEQPLSSSAGIGIN